MKKYLVSLVLLLSAFGAQAQYPLVPIDSIQYMSPARLANVQYNTPPNDATDPDYIAPTFKNPTYGDTVSVEGVVIFEPNTYALSSTQSREAAWIQRAGGDIWSGVQIMYDSSVVPVNQSVVQFKQNMRRGRTVRVTGVIRHFQGETQLTVINVPTQVISLTPTTINPTVAKVEDFMKDMGGTMTPQFVTGEPLEGVYVELQNVIVYNPGSPTGQLRYNWSVQDANGNRIPIRDISGYFRNENYDDDPNTPVNFAPPTNGSVLPFIRGIITESGNGGVKSYYIAPLYPSDVAAPVEPPAITNITRTPALATSSDQVTFRAEITDGGSVTSATLHYAVGYANNSFTTLAMNNVGGDWYEATVPAQADGSIVKYFISAVDNDTYTAYAPDSIGLSSAYKVIDDLTSARHIQETPFANGASMFTNDTLMNMNLRGVVVSTNNSYDLGVISIQSEAGPWGSISIRYTNGDGVNSWKRGDSVLITKGIVTERIPLGSNPFGRVGTVGITYLEEIGADGWQYLGHCVSQPEVVKLPFDSLMSQTFNKEPYENMLIELNDVWVVQKNADSIIGANYGEFAVHPDVTSPFGFRADDYSSDLFVNRVSDSFNFDGDIDFLPVFRGMLVNSYGNWKLLPRNRTDISLKGNLVPPYMTLNGADTLFILRGTNINDPGASACDDEQGDISSFVMVDSSTVDVSVPGEYTMTYDVEDSEGNAATQLSRVVKVSPGVGIAEAPFAFSLYPVPAKEELNIRGLAGKAEEVNVSLLDMNGRVVYSGKWSLSEGTQTLSIALSGLQQGIYICQINSESVQMTEKFAIVR
ncbi:MAG: DUF5011 domain-containing protein [Bacteroidetes bacterium]|nr:MAG: DUF5011 domain-containing protein [Bacteroidota bacterium]